MDFMDQIKWIRRSRRKINKT